MKTDLLKVKSFQETLYQGMCGPASLKMVFDYYGVEKSESEIAKMCNANKEMGIDDKTIKKVAKELGFEVEIKDNSTFEDIQYWLDKKVPLIVDWFTRGRSDYDDSEVADGHYSVVVGIDEGYIYIQDPEIGKIRRIKRDDFTRVWFDFRGEHINPDELIIRQIIAVYKAGLV